MAKAKADDLKARGARVLSVFGPFNSKAMVLMSADLAMELFADPLPEAAPLHVVDGVLHDIEELAERDEGLAASALAASALQLAFEMANPYNSATSKAMCAKALAEAMDRLRELAPPKKERDRVDDLAERRRSRRANRGTDAADQSRP